MSGEGKPAIPPGVRLQLEANERRMRELGISQEAIDAMLEEMARFGRAEAILNRALASAILLVHQDDGWSARRRLKKALAAAPDAVAVHLGRCEACGAWLSALRDAFIDSLMYDATAPE